MNKRRIQYFVYGFILGAWTLFCACELPKLQEEQRLKVRAREQQVLAEIQKEQSETRHNYIMQQAITTFENNVDITRESITKETKVLPKYTDADLILLAQLIEAEGGIESYQCKLYIGSVVLNRMTHDSFPDGLRDVIFQVSANGVHQFSVTMTKKDGTRAIDCEPSEESLEAAAELLTYGTQLPEDVVVFYAENCKGNWVTTREIYDQVDHTIFAYAHKE